MLPLSVSLLSSPRWVLCFPSLQQSPSWFPLKAVGPSCCVSSGVKYLSKNTLKYYLSRFGGYLYFTISIFDNFYFSSFLKKRMYFFCAIHFPWHPKVLVQFWMLNRTGKCTHLSRQHMVIPSASDLADSLKTNALFVNDVWVLECAPAYRYNCAIWFA